MPKEYSTPGPRAVYPEICTSRSIATCSLEAQLLFDRLISQADDQGRLEGDAMVIKALCVPLVPKLTVKAVDRALDELAAEKLVRRYAADGHVLVQIVTWWRWQQSQRRAYPSRWPAPEGWEDAVYGHGDGFAPSFKAWSDARRAAPQPEPESPQPAAPRGESPQNAADRRAVPPSRARGAQPGAVPSRTMPESLPEARQDGKPEDPRAAEAEAAGEPSWAPAALSSPR